MRAGKGPTGCNNVELWGELSKSILSRPMREARSGGWMKTWEVRRRRSSVASARGQAAVWPAWTRLLAIEIERSEWMEIHLGGKVSKTWVLLAGMFKLIYLSSELRA